ncbi:MAG TPA: energy transducer TonB [Pyrinomonadaceae bacterium]|nr:energy transducer TonB [Pyrinomonadaceae bacterium]
MKYLTIALVTMSVLGSWPDAIHTQNAKPWVEVSRSEELFRVSMPIQPVEALQRTRVGDIDAYGTRYEAFVDRAGYSLWALVDANRSRRDVDEYLDACADLIWDGLLNTTSGQLPDDQRAKPTIAYVRELSLPLPGREYSVVLGDMTGTVRFFVADARIYVLLAADSPGGPWDREKFFESFAVFIIPPAAQPQGGSADKGAPGDAGDYNRVFSGREVTQKARVLSKPEPVYTESARKYQITGTVVLRALFSADGKVTDINVIKKLPHGLTGASITAARGISFTPAVKDGRPVSMYMELQYNFNLY